MSAGFSPLPAGLSSVVGDQHRTLGGTPFENGAGHLLLVGPGVSENNVEVVRVESQIFVWVIPVGCEPGKGILASEATVGGSGNEAAVDELHRQVEIIRELLSGVDKIGFDLDAASVEVEHGRQAGDNSEAAAPFAEHVARGDLGRSQFPQNGMDQFEIAGHKAWDGRRPLELFNAPPCFTEKGTNIVGQGGVTDWEIQVNQRHSAMYPFQNVACSLSLILQEIALNSNIIAAQAPFLAQPFDSRRRHLGTILVVESYALLS
jgi:hypothetical protein